MTKLTDTARTVLRPADAGRLADAARATIRQLIHRGHNEQAAIVELAMSEFLRGSAVVHIETLRHWEDVFKTAGDLLAEADPDTANRTAYQAGYLAHREIQAYEQDVRYLQVSATGMTYDNLSARLDDAYELLVTLPTAASPVLEARIQQVAELLSNLTYDTDPEHLAEAGIDPDTPKRPMTYENLNAKLNEAYEIMQALPALADRALDARVQNVANLLDGLTLDTFDETLDADGLSPDQVVEVAA